VVALSGISTAVVWTSNNVVADGTFNTASSAQNLLNGDVVYITISGTNAIYVSAAAYVTTQLEWFPTDKSYASS
jgi:predicted ThiF/HesA family dinucleotide-utilizing enzyme